MKLKQILLIIFYILILINANPIDENDLDFNRIKQRTRDIVDPTIFGEVPENDGAILGLFSSK